MLRALLFDLDGTLANTDPIHFAVWQDVLQDYGLEVDRAFYDARFSGRLNLDIIQDLLPQLSLEEGKHLSDRKESTFRNRAATQLEPLAGLTEILAWTDEHAIARAVVTNAPPDNASFMLTTLELHTLFPVVVIGEDLPLGKPHPLPYQVAMEQLGVGPDESIAFEDSPSGVQSAVGAGVITVGIASTHAPERLYDAGATLVVPDFSDQKLHELLSSIG